jgi:hypothetical protein
VNEKPTNLVKHCVYISRYVWGEAKLRSFQEMKSTSELIDYVLEQFLENLPNKMDVPRYRSHNRDEYRLGRSIYFRPNAWDAVQEIAKREKFSVAALIEDLLIHYLGLEPVMENGDNETTQIDSHHFIQSGGLTYDLGENPVKIDWKTGKPVQPE